MTEKDILAEIYEEASEDMRHFSKQMWSISSIFAVLNAALFTIVYQFIDTQIAVVIVSIVGVFSCIAWILSIVKVRFYYYRRAESAKMIELIWKKDFKNDKRFESEDVKSLLTTIRCNLKNQARAKIGPVDLLMRIEYSGEMREYHKNPVYRLSAMHFMIALSLVMLALWIVTIILSGQIIQRNDVSQIENLIAFLGGRIGF